MKKYKLIYVIILLIIIPINAKAKSTILYSANLGGLRVAEVTYSVDRHEDSWNIKTEIQAAGLVDKLVSFIFSAESKGFSDQGILKPELYNFSYEIKNKNKSRDAEIKYQNGLPISIKAEPPYRKHDILSKEDLAKYGLNSSDPNSAFVVPGIYKDPCTENSKSFDGVRSYEIKMNKKSKKRKITIDEVEHDVILCAGSFNPIVGYEESDFLEAAGEMNSIKYWYKFFEKEKMWIPLKFSIDTPIGALVVKANKIINSRGEGK